ncbi:dihydrolipoyl dehydrogenase [Thiorhodospira sibirica]|uniref:dihydrolipoyl dehydrogenase n=1 Tax=Thiorhodospira sibirica TaxID=154347 RepID=UPI00022C5E75|nr:dihydrolipoyl dehydrogenase [Thiorhodospira sibirica]
MTAQSYDVIVIGAGPAGYAAAIRSAQLGKKTACIDRKLNAANEPRLGGTCFSAGCIPSKTLLELSEFYEHASQFLSQHGLRYEHLSLDLEAMMARKEQVIDNLAQGIATLFKAHGITWLAGHGLLLGERRVGFTPHGGVPQSLEAEHIVLAPGSVPVTLPGIAFDGLRIIDSADALSLTAPPKRLGVVGAGVIGLELASIWRRLGSEVVLLDAQESFLSHCDEQIMREAQRNFVRQGLDLRLNARVTGAQVDDQGVSVQYQHEGHALEERVTHLLVAVGRQPATDGLISPQAELALDEYGLIHVNEVCETTLPGVYAVGDCVRGPMLAHKGAEEGRVVAERICGEDIQIHYSTIPQVIYTLPEIAWLGKTEQALKAEGVPYRSGVFPFSVSGRARAMDATSGMVKLLTHQENDRLLGAHIIGAQASELIASLVVAMEFGACGEDLARMVFPHPTLAQAIPEAAALATQGYSLHMGRAPTPSP